MYITSRYWKWSVLGLVFVLGLRLDMYQAPSLLLQGRVWERGCLHWPHSQALPCSVQQVINNWSRESLWTWLHLQTALALVAPQVELKVKSAETQFQEEKLRIQRQHEDSLKHVRLSTYSLCILQYTIVHYRTSVYPDFPFWILSCSFFWIFPTY